MDSSKKLSRLKRLLRDPALRVMPVHIVRRPEDVVCSSIAKCRPCRVEFRLYLRDLWERYRFLHRRPHLPVKYVSPCSNSALVLGRIMANGNSNKCSRTSRQSANRLDEIWRGQLSRRERLVICRAQLRSRLWLLVPLGLWTRPL